MSFSSGGSAPATVATVSNAGNAQFNGTLQVGGTSQSAGTMTVRNNADAEVDYYLRPGLTASQKGSFTYKDWNGNSQWYMVKDASNNWALNSAVGRAGQLQGIPEHEQRRHLYQCLEFYGVGADQLRDRLGRGF